MQFYAPRWRPYRHVSPQRPALPASRSRNPHGATKQNKWVLTHNCTMTLPCATHIGLKAIAGFTAGSESGSESALGLEDVGSARFTLTARFAGKIECVHVSAAWTGVRRLSVRLGPRRPSVISGPLQPAVTPDPISSAVLGLLFVLGKGETERCRPSWAWRQTVGSCDLDALLKRPLVFAALTCDDVIMSPSHSADCSSCPTSFVSSTDRRVSRRVERVFGQAVISLPLTNLQTNIFDWFVCLCS